MDRQSRVLGQQTLLSAIGLGSASFMPRWVSTWSGLQMRGARAQSPVSSSASSELRKLRSSFADIRCDVERASDIAARSLVRKAAKARSLPEAELQQLLHQASAANLASEDSAAFVRALAKYLDAIIREARGDPDPWRRAKWQGQQQRQDEAPKPKGNSYAAGRYKRDPAAFGDAAADCGDDPPF